MPRHLKQSKMLAEHGSPKVTIRENGWRYHGGRPVSTKPHLPAAASGNIIVFFCRKATKNANKRGRHYSVRESHPIFGRRCWLRRRLSCKITFQKHPQMA